MLPTPVSWFGGKTHLRDFILPHIEGSGSIYVEPFCGSANIFWAKEPHDVEVLNDLNGDIINFFRVLQDRRLFRQFMHKCRWTPFAIDEFGLAIEILERPLPKDVLGRHALSLDHAWAFFVRGSMAYSGKTDVLKSEFRRSFIGPGVVGHWRRRVAHLEAWRDRIKLAHIENRPALEMIQYWDTPDTVFYMDPPYVEDTRVSLDMYSHEMTDFDHRELVLTLLAVKGRVILSGYPTPLYAPLERAGWRRYDRTIISPMAGPAKGQAREERTEALWVNRPGREGDIWLTASDTAGALPVPATATSAPTPVAPKERSLYDDGPL